MTPYRTNARRPYSAPAIEERARYVLASAPTAAEVLQDIRAFEAEQERKLHARRWQMVGEVSAVLAGLVITYIIIRLVQR